MVISKEDAIKLVTNGTLLNYTLGALVSAHSSYSYDERYTSIINIKNVLCSKDLDMDNDVKNKYVATCDAILDIINRDKDIFPERDD